MSSEPSDEDIRLRAYHKFLHRDGGPGTEWKTGSEPSRN